MKYFLIWSDYDGRNVEEFELKQEAELLDRLTVLHNISESPNDYGTDIYGVIKGERIEYEPAEVVSKMRLKQPPR